MTQANLSKRQRNNGIYAILKKKECCVAAFPYKTETGPNRSRNEPQPELHDPRAANRIKDSSKIGGVLQIVTWGGEVDVVERIEHIPTELHAHILLDTGVLGQAEVETLLKVVSKNVASQVAKTAVEKSKHLH